MKYKFRFNRPRLKIIACQKCGLGGLTLVRVGAKIEGKYEHQTEFMCAQAQRIDYYMKMLQTVGIQTRAKTALNSRLKE